MRHWSSSLPAVLLLVFSTSSAAGRRAGRGEAELMAAPPVLPAMVAEVYGQGDYSPSDPVLALALASAGATADEALSGAAATVALDGSAATSSGPIAWAARRAGVPGNIRALAIGRSRAPRPPASVQELLAQGVRDGMRIGLARARQDQEDVWVVLLAAPVELPTFPRQYLPGESLDLALPAGTRWRLVDPDGQALGGQGPVDHPLDVAGEWLLYLEPEGGEALSLPLFVGEEMPPARLFHRHDLVLRGAEEATVLATELLQELRREAGLTALEPDPTLELLMRQPAEAALGGEISPSAVRERLRAGGFRGALYVLRCEGQTVAGCLEASWDSVEGRVGLLDPDLSVATVRASLAEGRVRLLMVLAGD